MRKFLFVCNMLFNISLLVDGVQNHSLAAYPWRNTPTSSSKLSPVSCPAGSYLSEIDRKKRENYLSKWLSPNVHPPSRINNYEDNILWLKPNQCSQNGVMTEFKEVCGAWTKLKKWSEYKCIEHLPDSARSEYFILADVPDVPRLVITRVWKTGTTALAQVFKCLFGRMYLQYSSTSKHRGPFIESTLRSLPFKHAVLVRNPLDRFLSGYTEILARLTFGPRPEESTSNAIKKGYGMINFNSGGENPSPDIVSGFRAIPGWPRVLLNKTSSSKDDNVFDSGDYDWLWVGQPKVSFETDWDQGARFKAFVEAVRCGKTFLWWAHIASVGWFLSGPRHVLRKQEALDAYKSGASSPINAALLYSPLEVDIVVRHEKFIEDVSNLLQYPKPIASGHGINPLQEGGTCRDVVIKPHNSGNEGSLKRGHLPSAKYYNDLLFNENPALLCDIVHSFLLQDYVCFDYPLPYQCRS